MVSYLSDVGNIRKVNQDYAGYFESEYLRLYVVADGMGGHNAGEIASKLAVDYIIQYVNENKDEEIEKNIIDAIKFSNKSIHEKSQESDIYSGMGTTITACIIRNKEAVVANVGDSSCFIVNKKGIEKVTKDHSLVQQLLDNGSITEAEALHHPNKNIITRSLGINEKIEVDTFKLNVDEVYKFIICTDGLTNYVSKDEIKEIVLAEKNSEACKRLIELSKLRGGRDNITVIVFEGEWEDDRNFAR